MKIPFILFVALSVSSANASWFSSSDSTVPDYATWSNSDLKSWLSAHNVDTPSTYSQDELRDLVKVHWDTYSTWTADQYANAQKAFVDYRDSTFDTWDESKLRQFLLEQGVVTPSGSREQLALLAKHKYRAYTSAASSFSAQASATASTAIYGDAAHQATKSASSVASGASKSATSLASTASKSVTSAYSLATAEVARALDDSKDYVYSTWDDNRLRTYLEEKNVIKTKSQVKREELLAMMRGNYLAATDPMWKAWSDSYLHDWLLAHGVIKSDFEKRREALSDLMTNYYYSVNDYVWSTWDDISLKDWLVSHDVVTSSAQLTRDKMVKLVQDNYASANDTFWSAWSDSDIRAYLIDKGYMRSDAQKTRDELVASIQGVYSDASARTAAYLTWPDARLRAYLREHSLPEPMGRPGLLQEVRIAWVKRSGQAESAYKNLKSILDETMGSAEESLGRMLELLAGMKGDGSAKLQEGMDDLKAKGDSLRAEL